MIESRFLSPDLLNRLILLCPDGIIGVNKAGRIIIFNRAAERLTGRRAEDVVDKEDILCVYGSLDKARRVKKLLYSDECGGKGCLEGFEFTLVTCAGREVPIRLSATLLLQDGEEIGSVGFFHDITERKRLEARLHNLSIQDGLSGLFNHRHFHAVLAKEMARARRYRRALSLICMDLDHFKQCNDKLGHQEGDNIIRLVGQSLLAVLRSTDTAFRYGGDEFMVLLPETALAQAWRLAERIRQQFNAAWPFSENCRIHKLKPVTFSIGVAEANLQDKPEILIKRADLAMYEAKRAGGDRCVMANSHIGRHD